MEEHSIPTFAPSAVIANRYELASVLGQGGFGTVYKARQLGTGQWVALKVLHPSASREHSRIARFHREMQLTARINHPHVIRLLDSGQLDDGLLFIVFEYVDGSDLADLLAAEGPISPEETKRLMLQVLDGLGAAHALGMVHRDIKPRNIMISRTGMRRNAQLLDFGIAAVMSEARYADYASITEGEVMSTPAYAAPEQLRGKQLTPQSDLYSWGLVFLECLVGRPVIEGRSIGEIVLKQVGPGPIPIPEMLDGHPLGAILRRATEKSLDQRATTAEIFAAIEACDVSDLGRARSPGLERKRSSTTERASEHRTSPELIPPALAALGTSTQPSSGPMVGQGQELAPLLDSSARGSDALAETAPLSAVLAASAPEVLSERVVPSVHAEMSATGATLRVEPSSVLARSRTPRVLGGLGAAVVLAIVAMRLADGSSGGAPQALHVAAPPGSSDAPTAATAVVSAEAIAVDVRRAPPAESVSAPTGAPVRSADRASVAVGISARPPTIASGKAPAAKPSATALPNVSGRIIRTDLP